LRLVQQEETGDPQQSRHEIASHGFCHLPFNTDIVSKEQAYEELAATQMIADFKGLDLKTYIFPRNHVAYTNRLAHHGYAGYRVRVNNHPEKLRKISSVLQELNVFGMAQKPVLPEKNTLCEIPSGYIINIRSGWRKKIPLKMTRLRWQNIISHAVKSDLVAHLWFHPHNLISAPETFDLFRSIIDMASEARDNHGLQILTQKSYCENLLDQP
jgi:hypothetical protein